MPYIERAEDGRIVCLYSALAPEFQQARNYLSTGKLQARLEEYGAVHDVAARLGVTFDEAVADICSRWPEWTDDAEFEATQDPAPENQIEEVRAAYEDSHEPNEIAIDLSEDDLGLGGVADDGAGGDGLDGGDASGDHVAEEADDSVLVDPASDGFAGQGVMVTGDPLKAAQMEMTWAVGDKEEALVSEYPANENIARLNELRGIALAITEGVHPPFSEDVAAELQALETFASWLSVVRNNADALRNAIRRAGDTEALKAIDIESGWPE